MSAVPAGPRWRHGLRLGGAFLVLAACYGLLASQGALPSMSPDETAVIAMARSFSRAWSGHGLVLADPRFQEFAWLHPRSFVLQHGQLLPVSFPLWMVALSAVGWFGRGEAVLWLAVAVSASGLIPFVRLARARFGFSLGEAFALAAAAFLLPTMVLYGNRSGFTLVPQLAVALWVLLGFSRPRGWLASFALGGAAALAIGLRPVEAAWLAPVFALAWWAWQRSVPGAARRLLAAAAGFAFGAAVVLGVQHLTYGSPWEVGYFLRDLPAAPSAAAVSAPEVPSPAWRAFFPYGFSFSQWRQNLRGLLGLGWWPWVVAWSGSAVLWLAARSRQAAVAERAAFVVLGWLTLWLSFYYGQGRYADHIGGQAFHLGNSLFRYLTPAFFAWTLWSGWSLKRCLPEPWSRRALIGFGMVAGLTGVAWACFDPQDGVFQNRRDRQAYAQILALVERESPTEAVWLSERSDKIAFPARAAATPIPPLTEIRRFLKAAAGPVWLYRRPPGQQERDRWAAEGLELVETFRFERELVYEVRLRPGF